MSAIPTILVSGPLGSGKTSLLRHLIGQKTNLRFAAVVNDFGEIGIDGDLLRGSTSRIVEVIGGCICCAAQGEVGFAVQSMLQQYDPDYVVIEMSGEGDPAPVVRELRGLAPLVELMRCVGVVDLTTRPDALIADCASRNAVLGADLLILNKADLSTPAQGRDWRRLIASMNPDAQRVETSHALVDPGIVLQGVTRRHGVPLSDAGSHDHSHRTLHTYCFQSTREIDPDRLARLMERHGASFVRAKGFVTTGHQTHEFQAVRGSWSLEPFAGPSLDRRTRIVFMSRSSPREEMQTLCERFLSPGDAAAGC